MDILEKFLSICPKERVEILLGDREFIGPKWLEYLQEEKIPYSLRLKEDGQHLKDEKGDFVKPSVMFEKLRCGQQVSLGMRQVGKSGEVLSHVSARKNKKGELLVVMHSEGVKDPCGTYEYRWEIECLFKCFKSNGFNMEDTHLKKGERLETLFSVLMIAFCYAYDWGQMQEPAKIKKHGYAQHSVFRLGLDALRRALLHVHQYFEQLEAYFKKLLCRKLVLSKSFVP